jgi:hypothetical protein
MTMPPGKETALGSVVVVGTEKCFHASFNTHPKKTYGFALAVKVATGW